MHTQRLFSIALAGALALGTAGTARAQDNPPPPDQGRQGRGMGMNPDRQLERMTRELALTPDQQSQIKPLLAERQQKMTALREDQSVSQEDRRARGQAVRQEIDGKISAILNDEQKQKYSAMQERMRHRGPDGQGPPPEGAPQPQ